MAIVVGDPHRADDGISLDWTVTAEAKGQVRHTRYGLLRWDDVVQARFPRSDLARLRDTPALWWRLWRSGYTRALRREGRRFARVIFSIHQIYLVFVLACLGLAAGLVSATPIGQGPLALSIVLVPAIAYGLLAGLMRFTKGRPLYVAHLLDDTAFTHAHAAGHDPAMAARLEAWAERIQAAEAVCEEIVVIGHSSSSFLAIEALDRILGQDPAFGQRGTPVSLVTAGSVIPWLTLDPRADGARAALARFGAARAIGWLDLRAEWDWLSIHLRDPLVASGLPSAGPDRPVALRVRIASLIEPALIARRRWNLFQMHFQLLMSSRDPRAFDYIAFVAGPEPVHAAIARHRGEPRGGVPEG